jgi:membrane protease YdiL (CAAX protease family)
MSSDSSSNKIVGSSLSVRSAKSSLIILGTVGIFFVSQIIGIVFLYSLLSLLGYGSDEIESLFTEKPAIQFLGILLISSITLGILWFLHHARKLDFLKLVSISRKPKLSDLGKAVLTYVGYFITLIVVVGIVSWLIPAIDVDQMQQIGFENTTGLGLVFVFLTLVIVPPIMEEIIFRGFLFQRLRDLIRFWPAAFLTSVVFALAHTEFLGDNPLNWIAAIDTFILSFFLIYLLQKTGSLWASIFLHGIKNFIAFVVLFII